LPSLCFWTKLLKGAGTKYNANERARQLWIFIFDNDVFTINYLSLIQIVAQYKQNELRKIEGRLSCEYWNFYGYDYKIYFADDGKKRILDISGGNGYVKTYYFVDSDKFIVLYQAASVNNPQSRKNVFLRFEDSASNIKLGKPDNESSFSHDDSELLGILYTMRFR